MKVTLTTCLTKIKGMVFLFPFLFFCMLSIPLFAIDAPIITAARVTNAIAGTSSVPIPITVSNFNNIGQFTLTMKFDTTKVRFVSASSNPSLSGMNVTYSSPAGNTQGKLVFTWTGVSNVSLTDGSTLANLTFSYVTSTGILSWAYTYGSVCQYKTYLGSTLTSLNDSPQYLFYNNGGISNRGAPITYAPNISSPSVGTISVPITANGFSTIGAMTLYLEYDPAVITYQNSFVKNPLFSSSFQVGDIAGSGTKRLIVIQWYGNSLTLANGATLCTLNFNYLTAGAPCTLNWYDNGPSCEYADPSGNVLIDMSTLDYFKNGSVGIPLVNILLRKGSNCGEFNVNLKPMAKITANLTKLTFTVKWAATAYSDVQLKDIVTTWSGLQQIGSRVLYGGYYFVTFRSTTTYAVNWLANSENTIMTFRHQGIGEGSSDFVIIPTDYNTVAGLNSAFSIEEISVNNTGSITNDANSVSLNCGLYLKDFLQGPYDTLTHQMNNSLAVNNFVPLTHPYNNFPWFYSGAEHISAYPSGLVDWVLVEIRSGSAANTVLGRRAGLLKTDGEITDTNGISPLVFHTFTPGNSYYVVVYHRSHFPVMTANTMILPNTNSAKHDFTLDPTTNVYSTSNEGVVSLESGIYGQISGDINGDNKLKYSDISNDRDLIMSKISSVFLPATALVNSTISGYYIEDVNMDGIVKYSGAKNDQALIISNIDAFTNPTTLISLYQGQEP